MNDGASMPYGFLPFFFAALGLESVGSPGSSDLSRWRWMFEACVCHCFKQCLEHRVLHSA